MSALPVVRDPLAIWIEVGDRVVISEARRRVAVVDLKPEDRKLRHARREHYQREFQKWLTLSLSGRES